MSDVKKARNMLKSWRKNIVKDIDVVLKKSNINLKGIQEQVESFIDEVEKDVQGMINKDIPKLVSKLKRERKKLERKVNRAVKTEIDKAKKFVNEHRKDLLSLQRKLEKELASIKSKKATRKKATRKKTTRKKTTRKKVAKKKTTRKKATRKKTTKKKTTRKRKG